MHHQAYHCIILATRRIIAKNCQYCCTNYLSDKKNVHIDWWWQNRYIYELFEHLLCELRRKVIVIVHESMLNIPKEWYVMPGNRWKMRGKTTTFEWNNKIYVNIKEMFALLQVLKRKGNIILQIPGNLLIFFDIFE